MIFGTDLHQFDVYNDGYFAHLPLTYVDGVILEIAVPMMPYEQLAEFLEEKCGCYFQGLYYQVPSQDLERDTKKIGPPQKRYCNDFSVDEMVDWAKMEVKTKGVEATTSTTDGVEARNSTTQGVEVRTSTKDKEKEKVSEDASDVVETRRCTVEVDSETEYESDDDSEYPLDKLVDYLSPENDMPADNVRCETFEEHDIYMNELLKSLKTADKDRITEDPFIFDMWRDGWKAGCKKIIALDGCFLKSLNQGEILTAIGRDGNNHIYPVAWAVGLIEAVKDVMPNAEHRQYARHIYKNCRKQYPGLEYRQLFWAASLIPSDFQQDYR
uniref:Pentatricopeptide repeat-containing protein n=1 Tax=Tanacetum cinerariifolium TaxID=118510 RepID=A0A6L2L5R2_TANCI|nr:pentatricopeptide repeat-containing protein [Tanacetum cinerariifolium]